MNPEVQGTSETQQEPAVDASAVSGVPATGKLKYTGLGASLFWAIGSAFIFLVLVIAVGYVTILPPGTRWVPQSLATFEVAVMHLAVLLFMCNGSAFGGGLYALNAWRWYEARNNRVLTRKAVVWIMFIGPAIAALLGMAVFLVSSTDVVPVRILLGHPPAPLNPDIPPSKLVDAQWNHHFSLTAYWFVQGLWVGLAWQGVLALLVYISNRRVRTLFEIAKRRFGLGGGR